MKNILKKYWHGIFAFYPLIYLPWFFYLEGLDRNYHEIYCFIDGLIPFCEVFIIPYILWFFYVVFSFLFLFFKAERGEFLRYAFTLEIGMTIAMTICYFYPNCVNLRPDFFANNNIFTQMVAKLYATDTSTNVFPSIHVLNSLVVCVALHRNKLFNKNYVIRFLNITLCVLICLSTLFLKQHSIIDLIGGIVLYIILYMIIYLPDWKLFKDKSLISDK